MRRRIATARYRELGSELRKRREAAGRTEAELAHDLGWSVTKVSRCELGYSRPSTVDVIQYLAFCGVYGQYGRALHDLCLEAEREPGYWLSQHGQWLEDSVRSLIYHETTASTSISYEPQMVPGLLQTEGYARAMIGREAWRSSENIEFCVRARMERQQILYRPQPGGFTFYLHKQALRMMVGDPATMHEQLLALMLIDGLPHVDIRVVPDLGGAAMFGGAFRLLECADHQALVYLDAYVGGLFLEDREHVGAYRRLISTIMDVALDERQSREYLAGRASDYDRERVDLDVDHRVEEEQLQRGR